MALIDELKLRRNKLEETLDDIAEAIEEQEDLRLRVERELDDFDRAIAALKPPAEAAPKILVRDEDGFVKGIQKDCDQLPTALEPPAEAAPELDEQASAQPDPAEGTPVPGTGEESRDQLCSVEGCEIHADDASKFSEEGYAPVTQAEPLADPIWNEPEPDREALAAADAERFQEALESSNRATDAEIDAAIRAGEIAKAVDYYDPKAMAERERRNPFNIFKREDGQ